MARVLTLFVLLLCCLAAIAQVQSLGTVSFAVPPGWNYEGPSSGRAILALDAGGGQVLVIALFSAQPSTGNADSDFQRFWQQSIKGAPLPEPIYEHKSLVGYPGRYAGTTSGDGRNYVHVYVLQAGQSALPVMVATPNRHSFDQIEPIARLFVEGLRLAPTQAEPVKSSIALADLAGEWTTGGDSNLIYVTPSGAYAGSSTVAHAATYVISSTGSYTSQYAGVSNRNVVRGSSAGTIELDGADILFHERGTNRISRYHFVAYQTAVNGAKVLTLLDAQYEPNGTNIGYYGEKWIRQPRH
jgi:hypothetical protein